MVRTPSASRHVAPFALLFVIAALAVSEVVADPETVEGMYLEKRGDEAILKRQKGPLALPDEDKAQPPQARPSSPAFKQGHLGFKSSSTSGGRARAFGAVLGKQKVFRQDSPQGNAPNWLQQLRQKQRQPQAGIPPQGAGVRNPIQQQQSGPYPVMRSDGGQESSTSFTPKRTSAAGSDIRLAATTSSKIISDTNRPLMTTAAAADLNQLNPLSQPGEVKEDVSTLPRLQQTTTSDPSKNGEPAAARPAMEKKDEAKPPPTPKVGFLQGGERGDGGLFSGESRHKAILGVVLGVVFVAVFVAMGIGLAAQGRKSIAVFWLEK